MIGFASSRFSLKFSKMQLIKCILSARHSGFSLKLSRHAITYANFNKPNTYSKSDGETLIQSVMCKATLSSFVILKLQKQVATQKTEAFVSSGLKMASKLLVLPGRIV